MTKRVVRLAGLVGLVLGVSGVVFGAFADREFGKRLVESKELTNAGEYEKAETILLDLLATKGISSRRRAQAIEALATTYCWGHEFEEALKALKQMPKVDDAVMKSRCAKLRAWACEGTGDHEGALAASQEAVKLGLEAGKGLDAQALSGYQLSTAKAFRKLKRFDEAAKAYAEAIKTHPLPTACIGLTELAMRGGDGPAALQAWLTLCEQQEAKIADVRRIGAELAKLTEVPTKSPDPALVTARRGDWLAATAMRAEVLQEIQWLLVRLLLAQGDVEQALVEAKALLRGCSEDLLPEVTGRISLALKGLDGNVARANQLLSQLRWGRVGPDGKAGTADDLPDPLASVSPAANPERDGAFLQALAAQGADWRGCLAKATLFRYWNKPKDALGELQKAFRLAPMEQDGIGRILAATMRVLMDVSGDPQVAERYAEYQRYGVPGPDGKKGTKDDLTDPVPQWLKK
jgi:tetratricopeptide (TPR) repeat protein